jgi:hypothetical protein
MFRAILAVAVLMLAACAQPATAPLPVQPETAAKIDWRAASTAEQCSTIGGEWRPVCMMGKPACVVTFKDAGKSCSDSSECSGKCVTKAGAQPGTETRGQCTTNSDPCGCFQLVTKGKADYPLCAD